MKTIVLISCVKTKLNRKAKARDLYTSTLFKSSLKYSQCLEPDEMYILSAKYGLLDLDEEIEPYELTLKKMSENKKKQWANMVIANLSKRADLKQDRFIFLAGLEYRKYVTPFINWYEVPLEGLPFGNQLKRLKELCDE